MTNKLSRADYLYHSLKKNLYLYLFLILILTLFRIVFITYFGELKTLSSYENDIYTAFFVGWKYDTMVSSYILALPLITMIISSILKIRFLYNFNLFLNSILAFIAVQGFVLVSIADFGFYSYFQDHINILFFGLFEDDTKALFTTMWKNYPAGWAIAGYGFFLIFSSYLVIKIFTFITKDQRSRFNGSFLSFIAVSATSLVLLFGGLRGGYSDLVLSPKYSEFSESTFINGVALNGVVTLEKAVKKRRESNADDFDYYKKFHYKDIHGAFEDYLGFPVKGSSSEYLISMLNRKTPQNSFLENNKPNIIIIIMESFGSSWNRYNSEEFNFLGPFQDHIKEDYYFENMISADNGTIGSLVSIGMNLPILPGARYLSESKYMQLKLPSSIHKPFEKNGYESSLIYGGKLGWRDIGKYFKIQGFNNTYGENAIKNGLKLKGTQGTEWGLYDEHLFNYIFNKISKSKKPQFFLGLSTSNHPPFEFPGSFKGDELKIPKELISKINREESLFLKRFKTFQYTNYKLAEFIEKIKNSEFGKNTIIAITGDHNFWGFMNYSEGQEFDKRKVPFYLYVPERYKVGINNPELISSHLDIAPTIYALSLSNTEFISFGQNLFSNTPTLAINTSIIANDKSILHKGSPYVWKKEVGENIKSSKEKDVLLEKKYYSTLSVTDFFIKYFYKLKNFKK